jgi:hypothetical protein
LTLAVAGTLTLETRGSLPLIDATAVAVPGTRALLRSGRSACALPGSLVRATART